LRYSLSLIDPLYGGRGVSLFLIDLLYIFSGGFDSSFDAEFCFVVEALSRRVR